MKNLRIFFHSSTLRENIFKDEIEFQKATSNINRARNEKSRMIEDTFVS